LSLLRSDREFLAWGQLRRCLVPDFFMAIIYFWRFCLYLPSLLCRRISRQPRSSSSFVFYQFNWKPSSTKFGGGSSLACLCCLTLG